MTILCLETSTKACSVALGKNGKLLGLKESVDEQYSHAENLTLYIEDVCKQSNIPLQDIDAVAVSKGPGSFTGLRIGVSAAKGLCYAIDKPLIAINSLEAMAAGQISGHKTQVASTKLFIPMIDARRMEVYTAAYDEKLNEIFPTSAEIIDQAFISKFSNPRYSILNTQYYFFGDGSAKCKSELSHPNAILIENVNPSAQFMLPLAEKLFAENKFEDVAYFEPFYLKDFVDSKKSA
jgi:tRNA threonylcarbamoyladenosine biosynthesis protein TsaB